MELRDIKVGLRVWVLKEVSIPKGESKYGTVTRVHNEYADHKNLNIAVLLDGDSGLVIGGLTPQDLDFE